MTMCDPPECQQICQIYMEIVDIVDISLCEIPSMAAFALPRRRRLRPHNTPLDLVTATKIRLAVHVQDTECFIIHLRKGVSFVIRQR